MSKIDQWSPLRIPGAVRQYVSERDRDGSGGGDEPLTSWDPTDWDDPEKGGWKDRITPNHLGQWLLLGAIIALVIGFILWLGQWFPLTHRNPWTLVAFSWPASVAVMYVKGREDGFNANRELDWAAIVTGRSVSVIPGKFVERFGRGDIKHIKFKLQKSRSYGAFRFKFLKLADLNQDREDLMSKATGTNRGPEDPAHLELPGPLTGEDTDTPLGRVFGVHGSGLDYHDSGNDVDLRVLPPSNLDEGLANDVLNQLELYDQRIIPELWSEIETVETQKNRYKQRAEAERDPELDRVFSAVDQMSTLLNRNGHRTRDGSGDGDGEVDEISQRAKEQVEGDT